MTAREWCWHALLVAGVAIQVLSGVGLVVLRGTLDRLHCTGTATFGAALVAVAVLVRESFSLIGDKALAIAVLLLLANPVLGHVTARAARIRAQGDWRIAAGEDVEVLER